jgi:hypothetical protein
LTKVIALDRAAGRFKEVEVGGGNTALFVAPLSGLSQTVTLIEHSIENPFVGVFEAATGEEVSVAYSISNGDITFVSLLDMAGLEARIRG